MKRSVVHAEQRIEPVVLCFDHLRSGRGARRGDDLGADRQLVAGLGDATPHAGGDIVQNMIGGHNDRHRNVRGSRSHQAQQFVDRQRLGDATMTANRRRRPEQAVEHGFLRCIDRCLEQAVEIAVRQHVVTSLGPRPLRWKRHVVLNARKISPLPCVADRAGARPGRDRRVARPARIAPEGSARRWRSPRCNCPQVPRVRHCGPSSANRRPTGEPSTHNRSSAPKLVITSTPTCDHRRVATRCRCHLSNRGMSSRSPRRPPRRRTGHRWRWRTPRRRDVDCTAIAAGSLSHESSHSPTTGATTSSAIVGDLGQRRLDDALDTPGRRSSSRSARPAFPASPIHESSANRSARRLR